MVALVLLILTVQREAAKDSSDEAAHWDLALKHEA